MAPSLYNVNLANTHGSGSQAGALSEYGSRAGFYACSFTGYQDTLYANVGTQVYLKSFIEVRPRMLVAVSALT